MSSLSLARFKITADILIAFAGVFFTEEIEDRAAIMLLKFKSVLYPQDATAISRRRYEITRFFLAFVYEHCITMKHFRFGDKTETSLIFFLYLFPSVWVFEICVWVSWKLRPRETSKENRFKLVSILLSKMFYGHAMFIGGGSRYLSFLVHPCRIPWIQKLTSIWTTL